MSLKEKSISGVKWNSFSAGFNVVMALTKTAIMARLLTPEDFGLMAMVEAVMVFGAPMANMGLGMAIIQAKGVTSKQLSTLYWLNIGFGAMVFMIMILISPFVADFYDEEQLTGLLSLLAVSFIIGPVGAQFNVLFQRELNFSTPVKIDFISNIISFIIAVVLAYFGWGVYALVYGKLARTVVNTTLMVFNGLKFHRPQFYFNLGEVKTLISFGSFQMAERYAYILAGNSDKILIGKLLGSESLGYYNIAFTLVVMPLFTINPIIKKVLFPVFSKLKDDAKKINQYYCKGLSLLMTLNVPLYIGIAIVANELVPIFFGSEWIPSVPILQIASISILVTSFGNPGGSLVISKGRADISFYWSIIQSISTIIFIIAAFNINSSLVSIALSILLQRATVGSIWHLVIAKIGDIDYLPIMKNLMKLLIFGLVMYLAISGINLLFTYKDPILKFSVDVALGAVVYTTLLFAFDNNIKETIKILLHQKSQAKH